MWCFELWCRKIDSVTSFVTLRMATPTDEMQDQKNLLAKCATGANINKNQRFLGVSPLKITFLWSQNPKMFEPDIQNTSENQPPATKAGAGEPKPIRWLLAWQNWNKIAHFPQILRRICINCQRVCVNSRPNFHFFSNRFGLTKPWRRVAKSLGCDKGVA